MSNQIAVLIVEGSIYSADLNVRELRRGGFEVSWERVETECDMCKMLGNRSWDIILSDNSTPRFNAVQALLTRNRLSPEIPFIVVSEDVSPESIKYAMKNGCCAYLLKENLHQLAILVYKIIQRNNMNKTISITGG